MATVLIENQQAIQQSPVADKIQQVKQENLPVYQDHTTLVTKEKKAKQHRSVRTADTAGEVRIRDRRKGDKKKKQSKKKLLKDTENKAGTASNNTDDDTQHMIDIVV